MLSKEQGEKKEDAGWSHLPPGMGGWVGQQPGPPSQLERLPPLTHLGLLGAWPSKVEKASPGGWTVPTMAPFHGGVLRPAAGHGLPSQCAHLCGPGAGGAP